MDVIGQIEVGLAHVMHREAGVKWCPMVVVLNTTECRCSL